MKNTIFLFCLLNLLSFASFSQEKPTNVILMIGDGMGLPQITTSIYFKDSPSNFEQFTDIGFIKTSSTSHKVTDSAAGATAFATGQKSYNRAISVSPDSVRLETILEKLEAKNYKTGLISLTTITHATPACFYAHVTDRDMHEEIAEQLTNSGVDFFAGAGLDYFTKRKDGNDFYKTLEEKGYSMDSVKLVTKPYPDKKYGHLLAPTEMPAKTKGRGDYLPDATELALNYFKSSNEPFFLMVEGSYIDWAGHANDAEMLIQEELDFDKTIGVVLNFLKENPNTLLVITADHETGGVAVGKGKSADELSIYFTTDQHTAELIPVFSMGRGSELFRGIYENNEIYHKLATILKL